MKRIACLLLIAGTANAAVPEADRRALQEEIAAARQRGPEAFVRVERVLAEVASLDAAKRGRLAAVGPLLRGLGPDALWPLADELLSGRAARALSGTARLALEIGVVEAAGALRDARLAAVWRDRLDGGAAGPEVRQAAAVALARLDTPEVARELVARARRGDGAVLGAMGQCRQPEVAAYLASAPPSRAAVRALAELGAAWAWQTSSLRARPGGAELRATAARALLRVYLASAGELRQAASNGFVMVAHRAVLDEARATASAEDRPALEELAARLR
jgi:hypothetical protein